MSFRILHPSSHTPKTSTISCLLITYTLSLCPKQISMPLIKNVLKSYNIISSISVSHPIKNKGISPALEARSSFVVISFQLSIRPICLSQFYFICIDMKRSRSRILIPFSKSVIVSRIMHLLFAIAFDSRLLISIALHYVFAIAQTFVDYYTSTYIFVDGCTSTLMTFSSLASFCIFYASTK